MFPVTVRDSRKTSTCTMHLTIHQLIHAPRESLPSSTCHALESKCPRTVFGTGASTQNQPPSFKKNDKDSSIRSEDSAALMAERRSVRPDEAPASGSAGAGGFPCVSWGGEWAMGVSGKWQPSTNNGQVELHE